MLNIARDLKPGASLTLTSTTVQYTPAGAGRTLLIGYRYLPEFSVEIQEMGGGRLEPDDLTQSEYAVVSGMLGIPLDTRQ